MGPGKKIGNGKREHCEGTINTLEICHSEQLHREESAISRTTDKNPQATP